MTPVMGRPKEDHPPLLQPGEHILNLESLRAMCVDGFRFSETRASIFQGFLWIGTELRRRDVPATLVVNGSFLTEEIDPDDVDFAVVVGHEYYDNCEGETERFLNWIRDDKSIKVTHLCDCHLCVEWPPEHVMYFDGIQNRAYWVNFFSKSPILRRDKGVAILDVREFGRDESVATSRRAN